MITIKRVLLSAFLVLIPFYTTPSMGASQMFEEPVTRENRLFEILKEAYSQFPSASLIANKFEPLKEAIIQTSDKNSASEVQELWESNKDNFEILRQIASESLQERTQKPLAVVSGLSVSGIISAMILAKAGYQVEAFEKRTEYTRNIQWSVRQAFFDELASIEPKLAFEFKKNVASDIAPMGSVKIDERQITPEMRRKQRHPEPFQTPMPHNVHPEAKDMMAQKTTVIIEACVAEKFLYDWMKKEFTGRIFIHENKPLMDKDLIKPLNEDGDYGITGLGIPQLIVIAEGAGTDKRDVLDIESVSVSPARWQTAGAVLTDHSGYMTKHFRISAEGEILLSGLQARAGSERTWVVGDIPRNLYEIFEHAGINSMNGEERKKFLIQKEIQASLRDEFYKFSAKAMEKDETLIKEVLVDPAIRNGYFQPFKLHQALSVKGSAGNNVILLGDAVGNAHWSVGGGMQIAAISHAERLKQLLFDLEAHPNTRKQALKAYSDGVLSDTKVWVKEGICDFYPEVTDEEIKKILKDEYGKALDSEDHLKEDFVKRFETAMGLK